MSVKPPGSRFPRWLCRARRCLPLLPGTGARGGGSCLARALRWRSRCAGSLFPRESSLAFLLHCEKCRSSVLLSRRNRGGSAATQGVSVGSGRCCSWSVPVSHRCSSECGSVNPWPLGHHLPRPGCAPFSMGNRSCSLGLSSVFGFCAAGGGFEALASLQQAREVIGAGRGPLLSSAPFAEQGDRAVSGVLQAPAGGNVSGARAACVGPSRASPALTQLPRTARPPLWDLQSWAFLEHLQQQQAGTSLLGWV